MIERTFVAASTAWAAAIPAAAIAAGRVEAGAWSYGFSLAIYAVGAAVCHQLPERSFHLWGRQLPVCARCAGIYVGAAVAALAATVWPAGPADRRPPRALALAAAMPTAATLLFEWTTGVTPANWIRAAAGAALGAAIAWLVVRFARDAEIAALALPERGSAKAGKVN